MSVFKRKVINYWEAHRRWKKGGGGRGGGGGGLGGGRGQHTLWPPSQIHPHFPSISMWNRKNDKCTKLKGKIIINVTLTWFERTCKTIHFNSILEFSILSDFKMRNVIIWHWFIQNLVGPWRRNDVDATSLCRIDIVTTSCACWEFGPSLPPPPPPVLRSSNRQTSIFLLPIKFLCSVCFSMSSNVEPYQALPIVGRRDNGV